MQMEYLLEHAAKPEQCKAYHRCWPRFFWVQSCVNWSTADENSLTGGGCCATQQSRGASFARGMALLSHQSCLIWSLAPSWAPAHLCVSSASDVFVLRIQGSGLAVGHISCKCLSTAVQLFS